TASRHGGARGRLPGAPVLAGHVAWFEGEEGEFAVEDVENLLGLAVAVGADVEAWWHLGLEHRPASRPVGAHLERQPRARDPPACAGRQYQSVCHASSLP